MKRLIFFLSIGLITIIFLNGCTATDKLQKRNSDEYYVHITIDGIETRYTENSSPRFSYELLGFDHEGNGKTLLFDSERNLRKGAYLRIYYSDLERVKTFEEVIFDEIPARARDRLHNQSKEGNA
ncbi:YxeA family protein [Priestia taiwanensis]|uniref:YxeA family protein n=1 Tax=Priestia taiwanensis TaxID=1347902 RepID=A0A917AX48_9BACI|nr:YxeA family protein [Priestia taiwanensis]MBM7365034.1 uncharacterized protein (TIGR01655 family) [Priestia taiwanensis]GGE83553.1 hypothetical protein GCM10007140_36330 [Priestia taiwanensis]